MLSHISIRLFSDFFGKSIYATAKEVTGVSEKIWRKGGPQRIQKIKDVKANSKEWLCRTLASKNEISVDKLSTIVNEIDNRNIEYIGLFSSFFWGVGDPYPSDWHETKLLAIELDEEDKHLGILFKNADLIVFKQRILRLLEDKEVHAWFSLFERDFSKTLEDAKSASELKDLGTVISYWIVQAIFRYLACWDVEFQRRYLSNDIGRHRFKPKPLFSYLLPRLNPKRKTNADGTHSPRGIFHLPMRHLLIVTFSLAYFHRNQTWPKNHQLKTDYISGWIDSNQTKDTAQLMKKIFRGTKGITAQEFDAMWVSMTKIGEKGSCPMTPWPLYIAANLWTLLFIKFGKNKGEKFPIELTSIDPSVYKYWWDIYFEKSPGRNSVSTNQPWPDYLEY